MVYHFYEHLEFATPHEERPLTACNMVASLDGKVTSGGTLQPGSLGSSFDRMTMNVIRSHFDAVLTGGNTARQHPFYLGVPTHMETTRERKGLVAQPLTVLLTKSGNLDPQSPIFANPPRPPIIMTSAKGYRNLHATIKSQSMIEVIRDHQGPQEIGARLWSKYQVRRLLVEGGPSVNYQFAQAKLLDELFLTIAPRLVGTAADFTLIMGPDVLDKPAEIRLVSVNRQGDELFLRYGLKW